MAYRNISQAKRNKKDEFYTQYADIQKEMNAYIEYNKDVFSGKTILLPCDNPEWSNFTRFFVRNFDNLGLRKLISTSYAMSSAYQPTLFDIVQPREDADLEINGRVFVLERGSNHIDADNIQWRHLAGNGDFRSKEVKAFRDEADFIITNPPFSAFREFLAWIMEAGKKFIIVGHQNAITYKEVFPLIMDNRMWLGRGFSGKAGHFISSYSDTATAADHKVGMIRVPGVEWFTNVEHGRRHQPMHLMTMADNIERSKHKGIRGVGYMKYENYDAIEVTYSDAIPSDYEGVMGVPISWLDKYCPEQFEILSCHEPALPLEKMKAVPSFKEYKSRQIIINDVLCQKTYHRIFIRKR